MHKGFFSTYLSQNINDDIIIYFDLVNETRKDASLSGMPKEISKE